MVLIYHVSFGDGSLGIKSIDEKVAKTGTFNQEFIDYSTQDLSYTDCLLSNSDFENKVYERAFDYAGDVLQIGHPRNDIFFYDNQILNNIKQKVYSYCDIPMNKKIMLYCPSYRDNYRLDCYQLMTKRLIDTLGKDWVVCVRLHPHIKDYTKMIFELSEDVIDVSEYPDIQELLVAADSMITDFSCHHLRFLFLLIQ